MSMPAYPLRASNPGPPAFTPHVTAEHPPADCLCTWTWTPSLGGPDQPYALKYANKSCTVKHEVRPVP